MNNPTEAAKLPPILTFQSVVDNTVSASAIVTNLYDKLPTNGSELVVYDINRNSTLLHLMKDLPADPVEHFQSSAPLRFGVTILRNRNQYSLNIDSWTLAENRSAPAVSRTNLSWPSGIYSLSHIALPFRADDQVYGNGSVGNDGNPRVVFGALAPRGETGVLTLTSDYFLRTRYNPFISFQESHLIAWLGER